MVSVDRLEFVLRPEPADGEPAVLAEHTPHRSPSLCRLLTELIALRNPEDRPDIIIGRSPDQALYGDSGLARPGRQCHQALLFGIYKLHDLFGDDLLVVVEFRQPGGSVDFFDFRPVGCR